MTTPVKHIYYLFGVTSTGKSTAGRDLANLLQGEFLESDLVYRCIQTSLQSKWPNEQFGNIVDRNVYTALQPQIRLFADRRKELFYRALWPSDEFSNIVVEGACCTYPDDRKAIVAAAGGHIKETFLLIDPQIDDWLAVIASKRRVSLASLTADRMGWCDRYTLLKAKLEIPPGTYVFGSVNELFIEDKANYQREGYTDRKWECLQMPKSLKGNKILDLGCNSGWIGKYCLKCGADLVVGVDLHWRLLERSRAHGVAARRIDLNNFPSLGERYDYVLLLATYQYLRDPEHLIEQLSCITDKVFILEGPIAQNDQDWEIPQNGPAFGRYASQNLIESWLARYFNSFECMGPSPRPDSFTTRKIWRAYMDEITAWRNRWNRAAKERHIEAIAAVGNERTYRTTALVDCGNLLSTMQKHYNSYGFLDFQVLEFGCGAGRMTQYLGPIFRDYYCTDFSCDMLAKLEQAIPGKSFRSRLSSATEVDFPSSSMDIVWTYAVLMHNRKEVVRSLFRDFYRVLKPGGTVFFQLPCYLEGREPEDYDQVGLWTKDEMLELAKIANFDVVSLACCEEALTYNIAPEHFQYHIFKKI